MAVHEEQDLVRTAVRGLVALWSANTRRWRRLRGKIFLRSDLYEQSATAGGADFAKLAANRAEISWSDRNLLAMLVRRLANSGDALRNYCEKSRIDLEDGGDLGWLPNLRKSDDARPLSSGWSAPTWVPASRKGSRSVGS